MTQFTFNRRQYLAGLSAVAVAGAWPAGRAFAKAPMQNVQAPAFYRFKLGAFEATVISDGPLGLGAPSDGVFSGVSKADMTKVLTDNFLPADNVEMDQNTLLINTGNQLVLFDTGDGGSKMFGPKSGRQLANLKAAGIDPKDIDAVVLTHAHGDHCWGIMAAGGTPNFPNAQIYMAQADYDFWTDEAKATGDMMKPMIEGTRRHLVPNRGRIVFVKDGQEFLPGIQAMAAPGHTVGHTVYVITSEGKTLLNAGDIAHHAVISTQTPRVAFAYDTDGAQGVATRLKVFDMLAAQRMPFVSYHFPWPGLGYLAKQGDGYRYFASPMQTVL
jgi:glyoxylase-like metal-dependent hydrolase (beta-lactamase superfamily II)